MSDSKYISVYTTEGMLAGEMVKLLLESFGIPVMIAQESIGHTYGLSVGPMGEVSILVPEDQAEDAKEILKSMESGDLEVGDENHIPDSYNNKDH